MRKPEHLRTVILKVTESSLVISRLAHKWEASLKVLLLGRGFCDIGSALDPVAIDRVADVGSEVESHS
jgi:hypothetical protein